MRTLKLFLVLFVFNNYFNYAHSKSVATDLSNDAEEKSLMEAFSELLSSAESDKIVTRSVDEVTFGDDEIKEVVDILLQKHPEAAPYLTVDIVSSKIKGISGPAKYLIKYIFDGLRGIERKVDEEHLKAVILQVMSESSALATAIKNEFANQKKTPPAIADTESTGPASRVLTDSSHSNFISEDSVARVISKFKSSRMIHHAALLSQRAPTIIARQLNQLQPLARTIIKTLIDKFIGQFGSQISSFIQPSSRIEYPSISDLDHKFMQLSSRIEHPSSSKIDPGFLRPSSRIEYDGSGYGMRGPPVEQDDGPNIEDTAIAVHDSPQNDDGVNAVLSEIFDKLKLAIKNIRDKHKELVSEVVGQLFGGSNSNDTGMIQQGEVPVLDLIVSRGLLSKEGQESNNVEPESRNFKDKMNDTQKLYQLLKKILPDCKVVVKASKDGQLMSKTVAISVTRIIQEVLKFVA